nr:SIS domain-containing protein [Streptomyces sp. DSM 41633]
MTGHWSRPQRDPRRRHSRPAQTPSKGLSPMSDSKLAGQFFDAAIGLLQRVRDEESASITAAGSAIADTVEAGGRL